MISLLIVIAIVVVLVAGAYALSAYLPAPYGNILQIVVGVIGAIYVLMQIAKLLGVMVDIN